MATNPVLIELDRGGELEAAHRGSYCIWQGERMIAQAGDVTRYHFLRSGAKFFQALAVIDSGAADRFGLTSRELALSCASHGSEPVHIDVARAMLKKGGLGVDDLECGPHLPAHVPSAAAMQVRGEEPTRLHNNCSGKHAGMLLGAMARGEVTRGYTRPDHPLQQHIRGIVAMMADVSVEEVHVRVDGCGAPTFVLPLVAAARAFRRFGAPPDSLGEPWVGACARLREAIVANPLMIAGHGRYCTALVRVTRGRVLCKVGADGFYGACCPDREIGIAVHLDDPSMPAAERLLTSILVRLGLLDANALQRLSRFVDPVRRNHAGDEVGRVTIHLPGWGPS